MWGQIGTAACWEGAVHRSCARRGKGRGAGDSSPLGLSQMERTRGEGSTVCSGSQPVARHESKCGPTCWIMAGTKGGIRGPCPPERVTVPPTFHPLPSLLNMIDFESESETDKTAHIRKRLHTLASISNCTRSQITLALCWMLQSMCWT